MKILKRFIDKVLLNNIKIVLFLSSYILLYIILIIKDIVFRLDKVIINNYAIKFIPFNSINDFSIIVLLAFTIILIYLFSRLLNKTKETDVDSYIVSDIVDETEKYYLNYVTVYLLPCVVLSIDNLTNIVTLLCIIIVVGWIHVKYDMIYINPLLWVNGYKVYTARIKHISGSRQKVKIIISKRDFNEKPLEESEILRLIDTDVKYTFHIE